MSLLALLAQQVAQKQQPSQATMGAVGPPALPPSPMLPYQPPRPDVAPPPVSMGQGTFMPDATRAVPTPAPRPQQHVHPHWWGRLILGQGEFGPGQPLGTAADFFPPTAAMRGGAQFAQTLNEHGVPLAERVPVAAMAAFPVIPGGGEEATIAKGAISPMEAKIAMALSDRELAKGPGMAEAALERMERQAELAKPSAVAKAPVRGLEAGAGMEDAAYRRAMLRKKPLNSF